MAGPKEIVGSDEVLFGVREIGSDYFKPCCRLAADGTMKRIRSPAMSMPMRQLEAQKAVDEVMTVEQFSEKYFIECL